MEERTTLSVPKSFAKDLRTSYEGSNDMERLKSWAGKTLESEAVSREEVEELVEKELRRRVVDEALTSL